MQSLNDVLERTFNMELTMKDALEFVDFERCNDFEKSFYEKGKNGTYKPSEKQMAVINKMPKKYPVEDDNLRTDPFAGQKPQTSTDFDYGSNINTDSMEKNLRLIDRAFELMDNYSNLKSLSEDNKRAIAISCAINQTRSDYFNGKN